MYFEDIAKYVYNARFLLVTNRTRFLSSKTMLIIHRIHNNEEELQLVCLFWDWLLLESNHGSPLTSISFPFPTWCKIDSTSWMSLDCSKIQEVMKIVRIQTILKTLLFPPPLARTGYPFFNRPMLSIDEKPLHFVWPISSIVELLFSCIHQQLGHNGLLHHLLDELFDCVVVVEWWISTLENKMDHLVPVFQCQSIFSVQQELKFTRQDKTTTPRKTKSHESHSATTKKCLSLELCNAMLTQNGTDVMASLIPLTMYLSTRNWTPVRVRWVPHNIGLAFACGFRRSFLFLLDRHGFSDKFVNTVQNSNPRYGLILKQRLNLNFNTVSSVVIANFDVRDGAKSYIALDPTLWYEFHLDLEASYIIGIKIDFILLFVRRAKKNCSNFDNHIRYCSVNTELIDGDDHWLEEATQCFWCCHWSVLTSFHFLCFSNLLSPKHWYHGIPDDRFLRNSAAFSLQFCPKTHLICDRKFGTTSFQIQALEKDQWPRGNLRACCLIVFEFFSHVSSCPFASHTMSLNIDMKVILPVKFSASHCSSPIIRWIPL